MILASVKEDDTLPSLKITWKAKKRDPSNGGYTKEILEEILSKVITEFTDII